MPRPEYGIATPSALAPPVHPEDAQPNEDINKRSQKLPPTIRSTVPYAVQSSGFRARGGFRVRGSRGTFGSVSQRSQFAQHFTSGNSSWRGRGMNSNGYETGATPLSRRGGHRAGEDFSPPSGPRNSGWASRPMLNTNSTGSRSANRPIEQIECGFLSDFANTFSAPSGPRHSRVTPANDRTAQRQQLPSSTPTSPQFKRRKLDQQRAQQNPPSQSQLLEQKSGTLISRETEFSRPNAPLKASALNRGSPSPPPPMKKEESLILPTPLAAPLEVQREEELPIKLEAPSPQRPLVVQQLAETQMKVTTEGPSSLVPTSASSPHTAALKVKKEEHDPPAISSPASILQSSSQASVAVKREDLSPSPPPKRKLITQSCNFYPFPDPCNKSNPNFRVHRRAFFLEKARELMKLGLKKTKVFSRDDGLVIEWSSKVPVWSDTFRPDRPDDFGDVIEISD